MKKNKVIFMGLFFLFFLGMLGVLMSMYKIDKQTEENTKEYTGTVTETQIIHTGKNIYIKIFTEEYNNYWITSTTNNSEFINIDNVSSLQKGDIIFFRIGNNKINLLNSVEFIDIVSLKTSEKYIFSLDDYNEYMMISAKPARIAGVIVTVMFLGISIYLMLSLKKKI